MKIKRFPAILALALICLTLLAAPFVSPADTAFGAEKQPAVVLPENRFADFEFIRNPATKGVLIRISNLDDRVTYKEFKNDIVIKTASGAEVSFKYYAYDSLALIAFDLPDENVYLTLSDRLNALPPPTLTAPAIYATVPISVDPDSYKAAAKSVRSGTVFLTVSSLESNAEFMGRAADIFDGFAIREEYCFKLELTHRKLGAEEPEPLYYGSEGKTLKLRVRLPEYDKKSKYAIVTHLGTHINAKTVPVDTSSGFAYVEFEIRRNGSFAIVAYATRNLPWWAVLLIVIGSLTAAAVPATVALCKRKKKAKAEKSAEKNPLPNKEETETDGFKQNRNDGAEDGNQTEGKETAGGQDGGNDTGDDESRKFDDSRGGGTANQNADGAPKPDAKNGAGSAGSAGKDGAGFAGSAGKDGASENSDPIPPDAKTKKSKEARGAKAAEATDKTDRADETKRGTDGGNSGAEKTSSSETRHSKAVRKQYPPNKRKKK